MVRKVVVSGTDDQLLGNMMNNGGGGGADGGLHVKVMTDEQMELLRRQISAYATICDQLVQMHKSITFQQDIAGSSLSLSLSLSLSRVCVCF